MYGLSLAQTLDFLVSNIKDSFCLHMFFLCSLLRLDESRGPSNTSESLLKVAVIFHLNAGGWKSVLLGVVPSTPVSNMTNDQISMWFNPCHLRRAHLSTKLQISHPHLLKQPPESHPRHAWNKSRIIDMFSWVNKMALLIRFEV